MKSLLVFVVVCALVMAGCASGATVLADPTKMTPEQLKEFAKLKDANVWCVVANTPYGKGSSVALNTDKGVAGTLTVDDACKVTFTAPPKAEPKPAQ